MPANSRPASSALVMVLVALVCIAAGVAISYQPIAVIGIVGVGLIAFAALRPYAVTIALICSGFTVDWLVSLKVIPTTFTLIIDAIALALVVAAFGQLLRRDHATHTPRFTLWLGAALAASILGLFFSHSNTLVAVLELRTLIRFMPLIFLPAIYAWSEKRLRTLVWLLIGFSVIQAPVALWQFFARSSSSGDSVGGTLGNNTSGILTTFVIAMLTLVAGLYVYRAARSLPLILGMLVQCISPMLNETKVFFIAAPLIWAAIITPRLRRNVAGVVIVVSLLTAGIAIAAQVYANTYSSKITTAAGQQQLLASETQSDLTKDGNLTRIAAVKFSYGLLVQSPETALFGFGSGAAGRSDLSGTGGLLYSRYGQLLHNMTFLVRLLLESGVIGALCFIAFLISVFLAGLRLERDDSDPFWKGVGMGVQGMVLTMASLSVYTATFNTSGLACTIWTISGVCIARLAAQRALATQPQSAPAAPVKPAFGLSAKPAQERI